MKNLFRNLFILLSLIGTIGVAAESLAADRILDGPVAIQWLRDNKYIDNRNIPTQFFYTFRSQVLGGGIGPRGLKAIMANGWSFSGSMTAPISEPVVIVIADQAMTPYILIGQTIAPKLREFHFNATCTSTTFNIGSMFTCRWDQNGCTDSVFTIMNIVGNEVKLWREDQSCPASPGLTASYEGVLSGRHVDGSRTIVNPGNGKLRPGKGTTAGFTGDF